MPTNGVANVKTLAVRLGTGTGVDVGMAAVEMSLLRVFANVICAVLVAKLATCSATAVVSPVAICMVHGVAAASAVPAVNTIVAVVRPCPVRAAVQVVVPHALAVSAPFVPVSSGSTNDTVSNAASPVVHWN